jgi:CheY-like chemotaxis protein
MSVIAIVEDNVDNQILTRAILEDHYDVIIYASGSAALQGLQKTSPDLILLDISLPEMDGTEVLKQIRSHSSWRSIPVLALTAYAMDGDREKFLKLGFDGYVAKPIADEMQLLEPIRHLLRFGRAQ